MASSRADGVTLIGLICTNFADLAKRARIELTI
jgi:hypothetical protein